MTNVCTLKCGLCLQIEFFCNLEEDGGGAGVTYSSALIMVLMGGANLEKCWNLNNLFKAWKSPGIYKKIGQRCCKMIRGV
jgi:hypothetical protein